ncbi:MAG: phasin family protein [Anaerolineae bacterium]|nr:phasin family protein [Anaerolineae bacterium]MCB9131388.1 phasin family protein [Anaerolineales bacterium]MCB0235430.1 phasin family protein [Anaerolineae bacterium]MCB0239129.1 phasin family protein [Anaerolineae bacterium]MCB0245427.1 phasin family protein [Anaerolineae bacterium]
MTTNTLEMEINEAVNGANGTNGVATIDEAIDEIAAEATETSVSMVAMVRKVLQAGVGAFALSVDEVEEFVARLVERGEIAEQDGRKVISDVLSRRRGNAEVATEKVQEQTSRQWSRAEAMLDQQIDNILARLNVPSKSDIELLSAKVSELAEKVDALRQN